MPTLFIWVCAKGIWTPDAFRFSLGSFFTDSPSWTNQELVFPAAQLHALPKQVSCPKAEIASTGWILLVLLWKF